MGIDIRIRGRYGSRFALLAPAGQQFLSDVHAWWMLHHRDVLLARNRFTGLADGVPALGLALHHAAENVVFTIPRRGHIEVVAKTSTVGPGYHMYVCDALHALADELQIRWDPPHDHSFDEGHYFYSRNPSDVHAEMRKFIRNLASHAVSAASGNVLQLSMSADWRYEWTDADVLTPLGPRDRAWLEGAAADGARGIDIFPWWHRGRGAHYWLGRALIQMWSDVRWRTPFTDEQEETLRDVHAALSTAYAAEPQLTYPWREWSEIAGYLGETSELASVTHRNAARAPETPPIGYRRGEVIAGFYEGWSVRVPGAFAEEWDEGTWVAWEPGRWVRIMTFTSRSGDAYEVAAEKTREIIERERAEAVPLAGGGIAALYRNREDDGEGWTLQSLFAGAPNALALCTIVIDDIAQRDWAIATRQSLHFAAPYEIRTVVVDEP